MSERIAPSLTDSIHDIPDQGAVRFGKLWLDKEDKGVLKHPSGGPPKHVESTLHWPGAIGSIPLNDTETEIMRLFIAASNPNSHEGAIISSQSLLKAINERRNKSEKKITESLLRNHFADLRSYLQKLTRGAISLEIESNTRGVRGYFLKINHD